MPEGTSFPQKNVVVTQGYFPATIFASNSVTYASVDSVLTTTGTIALLATVPADGAELLAGYYTFTTGATATTSGAQQWSISDGTNVLATMAATNVHATSVAFNTVLTLTPGTSTNGKAIATTGGKRLILTSTETGTITVAHQGFFTFVWAM